MQVLAIVHQRDAGPGVFAEAIAEAGGGLDEWTLAERPEPPADPLGYDAVFVLGGAINVDEGERHGWIAEEEALLRELLAHEVPLLGLCLGGQLLAAAAGAESRRASRPEIGWHRVDVAPEGADDPLLGPLAPSFEAFQWHSYEFPLPPAAVPLARSEVCLQAARLGERAWALQFHPEVSRADALHWVDDYEADPDAVRIGIDPAVLGPERNRRSGRSTSWAARCAGAGSGSPNRLPCRTFNELGRRNLMHSWTDPPKKALLIAITALAVLAPSAGAATVVNGDFETGNLNGWQQYHQFGSGEWFTYDKADAESSSFFPPPSGQFAAVNGQGDPDYEALYQDFALEPYFTHQLALTYYYVSTEPIFVPSPEALALAPGEENQHVRVDVIKSSAPLDTVSPSDILTTLFVSKTGDSEVLPPTRLTADLTPYAGQTVRLRIATSVTDGPIHAGLDDVSITSTPPSNVISRGKLTLNKAKGTGSLAVNVPGPGTLLEIAKGKTKKIKRTEVAATGAGTVQLPLKPTFAGRKILKAKGKLKTRVDVFFTPTGGTASAQTYGVTLKKATPKR